MANCFLPPRLSSQVSHSAGELSVKDKQIEESDHKIGRFTEKLQALMAQKDDSEESFRQAEETITQLR